MSSKKKFLFLFVTFVLVLVIVFLSIAAYKENMPNELIVAIVILAVLISTVLIWFVPKFYVNALPDESGANFDLTNAKLNLENNTRLTIAQIVGGMVLLGGVVFTFNTFRLQQEGQITDRFTSAVTQLGNEKIEVRLGGLYALERLAKDSVKDHPTVMEVLSAYIRESSKKKQDDKPAANTANTVADKAVNAVTAEKKDIDLATDVQAAFSILNRRRAVNDLVTEPIDLTGSDLSGAKVAFANLPDAELSRVKLRDAYLFRGDFRRTRFYDADMRDAYLSGSNFTKAWLWRADLSGADLSGAELTNATLLGADLKGTVLYRAQLRGADLKGVKNLIFDQLAEAHIDEQTTLPDYLEDRRAELLEMSRNNPLQEDPWWKDKKDWQDDFDAYLDEQKRAGSQ